MLPLTCTCHSALISSQIILGESQFCKLHCSILCISNYFVDILEFNENMSISLPRTYFVHAKMLKNWNQQNSERSYFKCDETPFSSIRKCSLPFLMGIIYGTSKDAALAMRFDKIEFVHRKNVCMGTFVISIVWLIVIDSDLVAMPIRVENTAARI